MRWIENALNNDYKINDGRNFQFTKFSFTDFVLTDRRSLSGKQPKSASYKSSSCRFSFWAERNVNTKATEYVTFGFSFVYWFFFPSRKVWTSLSVSDTDFFLYRELWKLCHSFINLTEWRQRRVTCQQLIGYINTREKIRYFFTCVVTAFLRAGNSCIALQFMC